MASRSSQINYAMGAAIVAALVVVLTFGMAAVVWAEAGSFWPTATDWAAVRFTLLQAVLSAGLSCLLAVPVARALARRYFVGRGILITLMGAPFLLPVIVAVLGLVIVFGRAGIVSDVMALFGLPPLSIYGLHGVLLAHVFFNLPLVTRMLLMGWQAIPSERFRLSASLGMTEGAVYRHLELPMLRSVLPGAAAVVFTICLTSFVVALTLGGGPGATTVELAIYKALRFDYEPARAAALSLLQFAMGAGEVALGWAVLGSTGFGVGLGRKVEMRPPRGWRFWVDILVIFIAASFLLLPLGAIVLRGIAGLADLPLGMIVALVRSFAVALTSTVLTVVAALLLALAVARKAKGAKLFDAVATLPLAVSGLVLGTGLFLTVQPYMRPEALALPVTVLVNALLSLPYVYSLLLPEARALHVDYDRLARSLALVGVARLRWVTLPRLARPLGFGAGLAASLSMGDLGVITLFAGESGTTLPLYVHRLMGAYRMEAAAGAALVLVVFSFALFVLFDGMGRRVAT